MAHKTRVNGTIYEIKSGKTRVNGTIYEIKSGKTRVNGTTYKINLNATTKLISFYLGSDLYYAEEGTSAINERWTSSFPICILSHFLL